MVTILLTAFCACTAVDTEGDGVAEPVMGDADIDIAVVAAVSAPTEVACQPREYAITYANGAVAHYTYWIAEYSIGQAMRFPWLRVLRCDYEATAPACPTGAACSGDPYFGYAGVYSENGCQFIDNIPITAEGHAIIDCGYEATFASQGVTSTFTNYWRSAWVLLTPGHV
jgi:hypothetical protein